MKNLFKTVAAVLLLANSLPVLAHEVEPAIAPVPSPANVWSVAGDYADVRETLSDAITARGMVVSYVSHASAMLARTAEAVGAVTPVYGDAEIVLFCKADLSHKLVAANPENIVLCPYSIAIYTLHGVPGKVYLATPKPYLAEPTLQPVTKLLKGIIDEVVNW